ncbi:MAG TPA: helix-turn-helix transcriptional regulator, partial [Tepidiformaceae bacterium]|nr:helix-turn-helix transcriptional regulator [Tepidiformaceae bacterium]
YADLFRGALAISDGDLDDALTAARKIDPAATSQETQARVNFEALLGEIEIARGGDTRRLGVRRHFELLDGMLGMGWMVRPLLVALDQGPVAARAVLPGAVTIAASTPVDEDWLTMMSYLSIAAVLSDDRQAAAALIEPLRPYADQWIVLGNGAATRGPVSSLVAVLAAAAGMEEEATTFRARALASLRTASAPGLEFWLDIAPLPLRARTRASAAVSPREAEVLALLARGHSNQEIANALVLSIRTVQRHVENLYRRLGVSNRAGATLAAVDLGLISPADVRETRSG